MLNCAVIGVGQMGKNHARVYSDIPNVNLVAVSDPDTKAVQELSKRFRCKAYTDYEKLLKDEKLDIVSIAVPTNLHKKVAIDAMAHGIHVLVEKPIALSLEEGQEMIDFAKKKDLKLMIGHIERFNPAIIELKKRIDKGELGKIFKIDVNRVGPFPARIKDVGVVIDLAVHDIDVMRNLTGSEVVRTYAEIEKRIHTSYEDLLSGLLKFDNGTICYMNVNWLTPTKIRKLYITGEKGMFVADYLKQDIFFYENAEMNKNPNYAEIMQGVSEGKMIRFAIKKKEPLLAEIEHFIDCVENNKQPIVSGTDGLKALEIANRLIESANKGKVL